MDALWRVHYAYAMEQYVRWRRRFWTLALLTYLLPTVWGWWLLSNGGLGSVDSSVLMLAGGAALALGLSWLAFIMIARPLEDISKHISTLQDGDIAFRTRLKPRGFWGQLLSQLNKVSDRLETFSGHSQTELAVITAEAQRLRNVINSINDGVVALDKDAHIVLFNKAAAKISGYKFEEAAGQPVSSILPLLHGNSLALNDWLGSVAGADLESTRWENLRLQAKDSKTRAVDAEALYQGADPNGIRTLLTFHDRTSAQELEDMKVDFVALAAHELRTPISIIRGYIEILEDELGDKLSPEQSEFMRKLSFSASQLSGFINNILHVSRIEHGDLSLKLEELDWSQLVIGTTDELKQKASVQGKKLEFKIASGLPHVAVDKMSITEVINNLVDNAIKYSGQGTTVTLSVRQNGEMIETTIQDQGVGIPENAIDKLFTKFYRSHRTRTSHRGTGLGLYMSKSVVEAHGGSIWVRSKVDEGSTFGFLLPVYNKDTQPHINVEKNNQITRGVHGWIKNHSLYRG